MPLKIILSFLHVVGDSKMIIDWLNQRCRLQVLNLEFWLLKVKELVTRFTKLESQYIYGIFNQEVDDLSKKVLSLSKSRLVIKEYKSSLFIFEAQLDVFLVFHNLNSFVYLF